jgi:hypothetical protein
VFPGEWVLDTAINKYFELLFRRAVDDPSLPRIWCVARVVWTGAPLCLMRGLGV